MSQALAHTILVSQQKEEADVIIQNAMVADVFNLQWRHASIVIADGIIVAIDEDNKFSAKQVVDAEGRYVIPGLIDGHIHIESSMLPPSEFSRIVLPHGITSVVTDPHEIANVAGTVGLQYMLDDAATAELDIYVMLPSSVPGTSFENAGAVLHAKDLAPFVEHERVLGLAEVMDFPAVLTGEAKMLEKINMARVANIVIDGHGAGLNTAQIRGYRVAGIATDHECVTADEALDRVTQGMYVLMREGSAAKNVRDLLPAVTSNNAHRFLFCTDDKHLDELMEEGSINHAVALAIADGMEPLQAIQLATLNAANCYRLFDKGALAPGYVADIVLLDDLSTMKAHAVWKNGVKIAENGAMLSEKEAGVEVPASILASVHLPKLSKKDLELPFVYGSRANVIEIIPNQITTKKVILDVPVEAGVFVPSVGEDLLKLAVVERHHQLGNIGLGIVKGFGLRKGAVATTVAHDSHNALVLGTNDEDMLIALNALSEMQGGFVVVADGRVLASLALPIGGLMSQLNADDAEQELHALHEALHELNSNLQFHLFLTLSFISLPVIPEVKLTDTGLFDVTAFTHIPVECKEE